MNRKDIFDMMKNLGEADFDAFPSVPPFEDAEVIHTYSRAEAIEDGVLIDVSKQATAVGITLHSAMTPGVWAEMIANPDWQSCGSEENRIEGVLAIGYSKLEKEESNQTFFSIQLINHGEVFREVQLRAHRGPGDNLEPVFTVMLSHED